MNAGFVPMIFAEIGGIASDDGLIPGGNSMGRSLQNEPQEEHNWAPLAKGSGHF